MSNRIGRPSTPTAVPTPPTTTPQRTARPATTGKAPASRPLAAGSDSGATRPSQASPRTPAALLTGTAASAVVASEAAALPPAVHGATGYEAHFGMGGRTARAIVEGQG